MNVATVFNRNFMIGLVLEAVAIALYRPLSNYFFNQGTWIFGPVLTAAIYAGGIYFIFQSNLAFGLKLLFSYWWIGVIAFFGIQAGVEYVNEWREFHYETYLIPDGYHGKLVIELGCKDGLAPTSEVDQVLLIVGNDGTLRSTYVRKQYRFFNEEYPRFFYVDRAGKRTPIKLVGDPAIKPAEVFVEFLKSPPGQRCFLICTQKEHEAYFN